MLTTAVPTITTAVPPIYTAVPMFTTAVPPIYTAVPMLTTAVPMLTTAVPMFTTAVPMLNTAVPPIYTAVPMLTTAVPMFTTSVPPIYTAAPQHAISRAFSSALQPRSKIKPTRQPPSDSCAAFQGWRRWSRGADRCPPPGISEAPQRLDSCGNGSAEVSLVWWVRSWGCVCCRVLTFGLPSFSSNRSSHFQGSESAPRGRWR
jgi:hypothetical protein